MKFIRNGPDIPESLLQAHEEGRVVFFCGAGISRAAKLPGFSGLVDRLYKGLGVPPNAVQQAAIRAKQFDTAIGLLEADIAGGRERVRPKLAEILTPDLAAPNATVIHEALLTLGKTRDGRNRLITTNFDRLFEEVITRKGESVAKFEAPLLPVPKNRWNGLVYLHGLLQPESTPSDLDRLVVSSGDFGLAYLTERWASRFVSELFRSCAVCFVGYSITDPVMRYMMDALAADSQRGESTIEMFAFGSYSKEKEADRANEWRAKNVTPILYREHDNHAYLRKTLRAWSETYRDGVRGKERIVVEHAMALPMMSTTQDDFVGRLMWALSDYEGTPARKFAEFDPVPSLDWLVPLSDARYGWGDLSRFAVQPRRPSDETLKFSLIHRPAPYANAPWMALVGQGSVRSQWDSVMTHLACWLLRHLNNPKLVLWLAKRGGQLHEDFARRIEWRLKELASHVGAGGVEKLNEISASAPDAIPCERMLKLWRLLLTGRVKSTQSGFEIYDWLERFRGDGLTTFLRLELRELLKPCVSLREPFSFRAERDEPASPERMKDLVEWEVVLSADEVRATLLDLGSEPQWEKALPELLPDLSGLLRDALDLMRELEGADDKSDSSYWHQPSVSRHEQNRGFHDWTMLIELVRDAWLATARQNPVQARLSAEAWWHVPYPLFRRLAFFAAAQDDLISPRVGLAWLLADDHWWLWSIETAREALRLMVALVPKVGAAALSELEAAVLAGPPREMFNADIEAADWVQIRDHGVWLRLAKMRGAGALLGMDASARLQDLSARNPRWQLAEDQRDEFPVWMDDGAEWRQFVLSPRRRREMVDWLRQEPVQDRWQEDDWRQRCRDNFPTTACALCALAREELWPVARWRQALQAWSEDALLKRSWRYMAPVLVKAPADVFEKLAHQVSWWLQAVARTFEHNQTTFVNLCRRVLDLVYEDEEDADETVMRAINHPVGQVTEAMLRWWYRQSPEDEQGLTDQLRPVLTDLCDTQVAKFRHGRVVLAAHVIALFRVDPEWTKDYLLPLFDWQRSVPEARGAWKGFLWTPRLYRPMLEAIKQPFLDAARYYNDLGKHAEQYASLLTFAALDPGETFTKTELATATRAFPQEGLNHTARTLVRALEGAGDQSADYWTNRVAPYFQSIWPKSRDRISPAISESMGRLCIAAVDVFPDALRTLRHWLQPLQYPDRLIRPLHKADICKRFPEDALVFLDAIISDQCRLLPVDLEACANAIRQSSPALATDARLVRLQDFLARSGQG